MSPAIAGRRQARAAGVGLTGLLVALCVSLLVSLASLQVMTMANREYLLAEQAVLMDEQAAFVFDLVGRLLQQVGHRDASRASPWPTAWPDSGAVTGEDNASFVTRFGLFPETRPASVLGSDALAVYLPKDAPGPLRNCGSVPSAGGGTHQSGWSLLDVARGADGEPELRCRYQSDTGWNSQAIASGVTGFQLLYGLDPDRDGLPNDFTSATRVQALDARRPNHQPSLWTQVVAVRLALLLRSPQRVPVQPPRAIALFGANYTDGKGQGDPGVQIGAGELDPYRLWREYDAVIFLHHSLAPA